VTPRLVIRSVAQADIAEAALWYESRATGLGAEFLRAVDVTLAEISRAPQRYPLAYHACRRAQVRRFPYAVYFLVDPQRISVAACMHAHRNPRTWQRRVSDDR
jgi:plasmid stabilization system protein ParE